MMKSNSLTNRILALAMTLVMILGMLPSGIVSAENADTTTIYFKPLQEWIAAGYRYSFYYTTMPDHFYFELTDTDGDGIYTAELDSKATTDLLQSKWPPHFFVADGEPVFENYKYWWYDGASIPEGKK